MVYKCYYCTYKLFYLQYVRIKFWFICQHFRNTAAHKKQQIATKAFSLTQAVKWIAMKSLLKLYFLLQRHRTFMRQTLAFSPSFPRLTGLCIKVLALCQWLFKINETKSTESHFQHLSSANEQLRTLLE